MSIAVLGVVVLSAAKCNKLPFVDRFYDIAVLNNSFDTIYSGLGLGSSFHQYPDTTLPTNKPALSNIFPQQISHFDFRKSQDEIIKELIADTLSFYIFSKSIYEDSTWSNVRSDYQVLQRYDLSLENLKQLNFKIPYPPTAEMAGMKMYP